MLILFSCWIDKKFTGKSSFSKFSSETSLPIFLKYFLIFVKFQSHFSYRLLSCNKTCILRRISRVSY